MINIKCKIKFEKIGKMDRMGIIKILDFNEVD